MGGSQAIRIVLGATVCVVALCVNVGYSAVQIPQIPPAADINPISVSVSVPSEDRLERAEVSGNTEHPGMNIPLPPPPKPAVAVAASDSIGESEAAGIPSVLQPRSDCKQCQ